MKRRKADTSTQNNRVGQCRLRCTRQMDRNKKLQKQYQPIAYHNKTKQGQHIKQGERAQDAATYWATEIWKKQRKKNIHKSVQTRSTTIYDSTQYTKY